MRLIDADAYAAELWKMRQNYQMLDDTHTADKIMHGLYRAEQALKDAPTIDAVPVDFINQKIVELQSCAVQHFDDGHELLATCVLETIRLLGSFLKEWRGKESKNE